jgi:iron complex outermembrane receptor protein
VRVRVARDSAGGAPVEGAVVRSGRAATRTDARGEAALRLAPGAHVITAARLGLRPDTVVLGVRAGADTTVVLALAAAAAELEGVVVAATRGERRVEDTPLRVEVIDEEEVAEKVAMTPGDIAMMLNETSGLRVQATNPSLGGANVRVQGLRGRYTLLLADGLPLYGGQAGGLGLLQIPPLDLARVEVVKGTASALYGSSALGGVINLVSRRPPPASAGAARGGTALVNQTTRGGTDLVAFAEGPASARWGYTLLAGAHRQRRNDLDADGWTDLPGYVRAVARPRLFFDDGRGRTAFLTGGVTAEDRDGGTLGGGSVPGGGAYAEALRTRRGDVGGLARWAVDDAGALRGAVVTVRGSAAEQRHGHRFGAVREGDQHRTWFGEAALAVPRVYGDRPVTYIAGAAVQRDAYRNADVAGFDYAYTVPAAFAQLDVDPTAWLSLSASARVDAHSAYGTFVNPRVSALLRRPGGDTPAGGRPGRLDDAALGGHRGVRAHAVHRADRGHGLSPSRPSPASRPNARAARRSTSAARSRRRSAAGGERDRLRLARRAPAAGGRRRRRHGRRRAPHRARQRARPRAHGRRRAPRPARASVRRAGGRAGRRRRGPTARSRRRSG